jgi:class 3 adenylate cyclase
MAREIRFCTTDDGVRIAYCVDGDGPDLVCCPEFVGSFALDPLIADQMGFWQALWKGRRVVRYDMRGTGLSQRDVDDVSHEALVQDLDAVVHASGAHRFTLWASTFSGPRAIDYVVRNPRQVRRLVLHRTFARATDFVTQEQASRFADLARLYPEYAFQLFAEQVTGREFVAYLAEVHHHQAQVYERAASGEFVARFLTCGYESADVLALLRSVRVPTLVLHWRDDPFFAFRLAQELAAAIPEARLMPLDQSIMGYLDAGHIDEVMDALNDFIDDGAVARATRGSQGGAGSVQTILVTDIVGHTAMMQRLGDAKGRDVLRAHERITRDVLKQHGGTELKTMGDGFMASFSSVTSAMDCAIALQRAFDRPLPQASSRSSPSAAEGERVSIRIGLDAGEPIEEDGDLFGSTVILASRVAAKAGAGEILIPEPVRHLLSGKNYVYADRGETMLKGFEDAVRLYEVRWQE